MAEPTNSELGMSEVEEEEEESMIQDSPWTWSPDGSSAEGADSGEDEMSDEMFVRVKPENRPGYEYIFVAKEWNPKQSDIYKLPSMDGWKQLHWVSWLKIDEGIPNIFINCSGLNGAVALFVIRQICPSRDSQLLVETWELHGLLYGWRVFAGVHKHTRIPQPVRGPDSEEEELAMELERMYWATSTSATPL